MCESSYLHQAYAFKACSSVDNGWVHLRLMLRIIAHNAGTMRGFLFRNLYELQSHIPCLDTVTMSAISPVLRGGLWPFWLQVEFIKPPLLLLRTVTRLFFCCIEPFTPPALCLTYPFSPFIRYSSLFLLILSKLGASFIFHHLSPTVCHCLSVMSGCLFSPPLCLHSLLLILTPLFFFFSIQNQTDDPDSPH